MSAGINQAVCPQELCGNDIDVPPNTFDGAELTCLGCRSICFMVVFMDGDWCLVDPDDE